jgi:hypothetical protein
MKKNHLPVYGEFGLSLKYNLSSVVSQVHDSFKFICLLFGMFSYGGV